FRFNFTRSIFNEVTKRNTLLEIIMVSAKKLLNADRCALFLVDNENQELYADLFDESEPFGDIKIVPKEKDIRFSVKKGIAGHVVTHGQMLNVSDAYKDSRFNRDIDIKTGYTTRSILCMPIMNKGRCIGAIQMLNKINGDFTKEDEDAFRIFTVYCNLALHTSEIYVQLRKSESKRKVALDSYFYHSSCTNEEMEDVIASPYLQSELIPTRIESAEYTDPNILPRLFLHMFRELFGTTGFDVFDLCRFTLTCRKNYRRVPYHNWYHAFNVTHSMYYIIKNSPGMFDRLECLAMFIGCLCHDLDHRGTNNAFQVKSENPLADLYSTSVLEQHHFNMTVMILQRDGHTILSSLSKEDHEIVMNYIHDAIIATDLALYFGNRSTLQKLVDNKEFDWNIQRHRSRVRGLAMTACDLIAVAKPWKYQFETVKQIFAEFYDQGDVEKRLGIAPVPMMDRDKESELPANQVGFINGICLPCYELLAYLLPNTQAMVDNIM
ncbi:uncharacterized protein TRIADDRAFT_25862, partial [Trichoplax adhaerens]